MSAPAAKPKDCEYRIFFPLPDAESAAASAPFSLFDPSSFALFQPTHSTPPKPKDKDVEQRDDLYLLDPELRHMAHYGLKLRGAQSGSGGAASLLAACAATPRDFKLELKILKSGGPSARDTPSSPHSAAAVMDSLHALPSPEEWKKVLRPTSIHTSFQGLLEAVLPPIHSALQSAKLRQKSKQSKIIAEFEEALQNKLDRSKAAAQAEGTTSAAAASSPASGSLPFRILEVKKSRSTLSVYSGEQTDVVVTVLNGPNGGPGAQGRWRSICFEGSEAAVQSNNVRQMFQHLLQTHGDARGVAIHKAGEADAAAAAAASASSSSTTAAAAAPSTFPRVSQGAFIGGYPEFLLNVLREQMEGDAHAASVQTAAAAAAIAPAKK